MTRIAKGQGQDLTGRLIGSMKVIEKTDGDRYVCQCECGGKESRAQHTLMQTLRRGTTSRCRECVRKARVVPAENLVGVKVWKLTVVEQINANRYWVQCVCGSPRERRSRSSISSARSLGAHAACKACLKVEQHRNQPQFTRRSAPTRTWA